MKLPSKTEMNLICALGAREINGRDLAKRYQEETGNAISYGTLYTTMRRLKEAGWIEARDDGDGDGRIRFFKLSGPGCRMLPSLKEIHQESIIAGGAMI